MKNLILSIALLLFSQILCRAQQNPFGFDPSFAGNGWDTIQTGAGYFEVKKVTELNDGNVLVCGTMIYPNENYAYMMIRYNPNGSLDNTFGNGGIVNNYVPGSGSQNNMFGADFYFKSDGKIIVAGFNYSGIMRIYQFNPNGQPDNSFGTNGFVEIENSDYYEISAIGVQTDGKIIGFKHSNNLDGSRTYAVFRLNADGSTDLNFGEAGLASINFPNIQYYYYISYDMFILSDDRILIAYMQEVEFEAINYFSLFSADGQIVQSFGNNGIFEFNAPFAPSNGYYVSYALDTQDKLYFSYPDIKNVDEEYYQTFNVKRLNMDGALDDFELNHDFQTQSDIIYNTEIAMGNNQLYVSCTYDEQTRIISFNTDGTVNTDFDNDGSFEFDINGIAHFENINRMYVTENGSIFHAVSHTDIDWSNHFFFISKIIDLLGTSIKEQNENSRFLIYPNPAKDFIQIKSDVSLDLIELYDLQGRKLHSIVKPQENSVHLNHLESGVYFIRASSRNQLFSKKIIISN
jgi:uncharacterized delta-60 repeat protein